MPDDGAGAVARVAADQGFARDLAIAAEPARDPQQAADIILALPGADRAGCDLSAAWCHGGMTLATGIFMILNG